jgi:hypothetical protein
MIYSFNELIFVSELQEYDGGSLLLISVLNFDLPLHHLATNKNAVNAPMVPVIVAHEHFISHGISVYASCQY